MATSDVPLVDETQAGQGQPGIHLLDGGRETRDEPTQSAGGDDGALPELVLHAPADAVDLAGEAVDRARLQRLGRALADDAAGLDQLDSREAVGPGEQRVHRDLD